MKLFVKLLMLASLTVGSSTAWAAAEAAEDPAVHDQEIEQAFHELETIKNSIDQSRSKKRKIDLTNDAHGIASKKLEEACKKNPKHTLCQLDKNGLPKALKKRRIEPQPAAGA